MQPKANILVNIMDNLLLNTCKRLTECFTIDSTASTLTEYRDHEQLHSSLQE